MIYELCNNKKLHTELQMQSIIIDRAERFEKENKFLHKVVDKFKLTITKFISWVCHKFDFPSEENLVRSFEKETRLNFDVENQVLKERKQKEHDWGLKL